MFTRGRQKKFEPLSLFQACPTNKTGFHPATCVCAVHNGSHFSPNREGVVVGSVTLSVNPWGAVSSLVAKRQLAKQMLRFLSEPLHALKTEGAPLRVRLQSCSLKGPVATSSFWRARKAWCRCDSMCLFSVAQSKCPPQGHTRELLFRCCFFFLFSSSRCAAHHSLDVRQGMFLLSLG